MEAVQTQPDYPRGLTFEMVWAALMEDREQLKESAREQKERSKEYERRHEEYLRRQAESDRRFEKLSQNVGGLNNSLGELIEILIAAHLWEKFPEYDLHMAYRRIPIYNEQREEKTDIDILLVNDDWAMVVEVKRALEDKDEVDRHVKRMGLILQYPPRLILPGAKIVSAIAGGVVTKEAAAYAHECGFYVLELKGESVVRVPAPQGFKPKEFR